MQTKRKKWAAIVILLICVLIQVYIQDDAAAIENRREVKKHRSEKLIWGKAEPSGKE